MLVDGWEVVGMSTTLDAAYSPANANGESPISPGAALDNGHLPAEVASRTVENLVGVSMFLSREAIMGMVRDTVVRMRHVVCVSNWDARG